MHQTDRPGSLPHSSLCWVEGALGQGSTAPPCPKVSPVGTGCLGLHAPAAWPRVGPGLCLGLQRCADRLGLEPRTKGAEGSSGWCPDGAGVAVKSKVPSLHGLASLWAQLSLQFRGVLVELLSAFGCVC